MAGVYGTVENTVFKWKRSIFTRYQLPSPFKHLIKQVGKKDIHNGNLRHLCENINSNSTYKCTPVTNCDIADFIMMSLNNLCTVKCCTRIQFELLHRC